MAGNIGTVGYPGRQVQYYTNVFAVLEVFLFVLFKSTIYNSFGTTNSVNVCILSSTLERNVFHRLCPLDNVGPCGF